MDRRADMPAGYYEIDGYTIERLNGEWYLTYPGQSHADDIYSTLAEAKAAIETHKKTAAASDEPVEWVTIGKAGKSMTPTKQVLHKATCPYVARASEDHVQPEGAYTPHQAYHYVTGFDRVCTKCTPEFNDPAWQNEHRKPPSRPASIALPNRWSSKFCCSKCMYTAVQKLGDWQDVLNKAVRIYNSGGAQIVEQDNLLIKARVRGDNDTYDVIIHLESEENPTPMSWACACEWGFWAWQRQHDYRGRPCSHCLAAFLLTKQMTTPELQAPVEYELSPTQLVRRHNEEMRRKQQEQEEVPAELPTRKVRQVQQQPGQPPQQQSAPPAPPTEPPSRTVRMV